jgi:predicted ArsR family transcriptional regulator
VTEISVIAVLDDPVRRRLYDYVTGQDHAVSRSEAAQAAGIQRTLAAFHLDRLAEAGLVDVTFRRPAGRAGPGAGRPAKLYRRTAAEHQVSVPPRDYRGAAELLAEVVDVTGAEPELQRSARSRGAAAGTPHRCPAATWSPARCRPRGTSPTGTGRRCACATARSTCSPAGTRR